MTSPAGGGGRVRRVVLGAAFVASALAAACGGARGEAPRLYAAASLAPAVVDLGAAGAPAHVPVLAGTSLLVQQIRAGAAPGVVLAADPRWAEVLEDDGLVERDGRVDLLGNGLCVIARAGAGSPVRTLGDLALDDAGRVALAETGNVPLGRYARAALTAVGVWDAVRTRAVEAADARAAVVLVARGEADVGIVYRSDADAAGVVRLFDVPDGLHPRVVYPLLLLRDAPAGARGLWTWLQGDAARAVFARHGFEPLPR